jgi:hypothetical protein
MKERERDESERDERERESLVAWIAAGVGLMKHTLLQPL